MAKINDFIICILGKSGSGKTTITERLNEKFGYEMISSYTTRPPRYDGEIGHKFVDLVTYLQLPNKVAFTEFNGHHYCATQSQVDDADLYVIDVFGLQQLKQLYHGKKKIVTVYVDVPMEECLARMRNRGDAEDLCWERLRHDDEAFRNVETDFVINGVPENAWKYVEEIIQKLKEQNICK